ncbi:hypothetical protein WR25_20979 [Diploscapter pachys]|uniref:Uncharacterized protein n=1 Tax=Diploscapter pachys TaxID=2018661 RepID=A0A2A2K488_9BILA|nr:hypothetical protein WR25_20979 [Diploscapter pachys]
MSSEKFHYNYEIVPVPGREHVQKNFATLPTRAEQYSGRQLSLNERFSIIERGYVLEPVKSENKRKSRKFDVQMPEAHITQNIDELIKSIRNEKSNNKKKTTTVKNL